MVSKTTLQLKFFTHLSRLKKLKNNLKLLGLDNNKKYTGYSNICNVFSVMLSPVLVEQQVNQPIHGKSV